MKIVPVRWIDEVLDLALERPVTPTCRAVAPRRGAGRESRQGRVQPDVKH